MIKVGDIVWLLDRDASVRDSERKYLGRGKWCLHYISGENKQSWLVSNGSKIDKKDLTKTRKTDDIGYCGVMKALYSTKDVDDDIFKRNYQRHIADKVMELESADQLRKIAEIIGYEKEENTN